MAVWLCARRIIIDNNDNNFEFKTSIPNNFEPSSHGHSLKGRRTGIEKKNEVGVKTFFEIGGKEWEGKEKAYTADCSTRR